MNTTTATRPENASQSNAPQSNSGARKLAKYTHKIEGHVHTAKGDVQHFVGYSVGEFEEAAVKAMLVNCMIKSDYAITKIAK